MQEHQDNLSRALKLTGRLRSAVIKHKTGAQAKDYGITEMLTDVRELYFALDKARK